MGGSGSAAHTKSAQGIDDETVLERDLFQEILHWTTVRPSGGAVYCTLVLVCRSEAKNGSRIQTPRCKVHPLATPVTARTGQILTPHRSRQESEWRDYCRRPSRPRMRAEPRTKTLPPDHCSALPTVDHDDFRLWTG